MLKRGVGVTVYPADTSYEQILARRPDGIMLSNGPRRSRRLQRTNKNYSKNI